MTAWSRKWMSAAGIGVLGIFMVLSMANSPVRAQGDNPVKSISVSGSGEVFGTPDIAYINLGVDTADRDVGKAVDDANATLAAVVSALGEAGVAEKDIQTANFNVFPEDRFDPQTGQPTGERLYHVNLSVNIIVRDIAQTGAVIQTGLNAGANSINSLSFGIADTQSLEDQARQKAVDDARSRAQKLADAFGVQLGEPIQISESSGGLPAPVAFGRGGQDFAAQSATQINPGQLSVNIRINVTFAIGE